MVIFNGCMRRHRTKAVVPGPGEPQGYALTATPEWANAEFPADPRRLIVLSNRGDTLLDKATRRALFGVARSDTLAVDRESGWLYYAHYTQQDDDRILWLCGDPNRQDGAQLPRFPSEHLGQLDRLRESDRPFCYSIADREYRDFLAQQWGSVMRRDILVISFLFGSKKPGGGSVLQLTEENHWRTISDWRGVSWRSDD